MKKIYIAAVLILFPSLASANDMNMMGPILASPVLLVGGVGAYCLRLLIRNRPDKSVWSFLLKGLIFISGAAGIMGLYISGFYLFGDRLSRFAWFYMGLFLTYLSVVIISAKTDISINTSRTFHWWVIICFTLLLSGVLLQLWTGNIIRGPF